MFLCGVSVIFDYFVVRRDGARGVRMIYHACVGALTMANDDELDMPYRLVFYDIIRKFINMISFMNI